jgi:DNA polymerase III gamma/tau subunit
MSLFDNMPASAVADHVQQTGFQFPASLPEKYRPRTFAEFIGLEKPKRIMAKFAANPKPDAFLFVGPSGIGKTTMALAFCQQIKGELHHVPSQKCSVANLEEIIRICYYVPAEGKSFHVILIDEAHFMTDGAQKHLLSKLDATGWPPNTIWIFTANAVDGLETTLLSRMKQIPFQSHGVAEDVAKHLEAIWDREVTGEAERPNFLRIVRESQNNVRNALNMLETELLAG